MDFESYLAKDILVKVDRASKLNSLEVRVPMLRNVLLDQGQTFFDHRFVQKLIRGEKKGRSNGERLFGLVMFELWRREYQVAM